MRLLITFLFIGLSSGLINGQNFFKPVSNQGVPSMVKSGERGIIPSTYQTYKMSVANMKAAFSTVDLGKTISIEIPTASSGILPFDLTRVTNLHPDLAKKYHNIYTFKGHSQDKKYSIRFTTSENGFIGVIHSTEGYEYIQPFAAGNIEYLNVFTRADYLKNVNETFQCGNETIKLNPSGIIVDEFKAEDALLTVGENIQLKTYRVALAAVSEYTEAKGGVAGTMAAFDEALTVLNEIYHRELAINFELIPNNEDLIYTNALSDPYLIVTDGGGLLAQNQANLDATIGTANYDIGHVFTNGCSNNLGGIAFRGSVCNSNNKGRGVTCHGQPNVTFITTEIMSHEVGHSFNSPHSWNKCPGSDDQYAPETAYEPGSGSTIMSYSGSCGALNNVQSGSDSYFNIGSLVYMYNYRINGDGASCGVFSDGNTRPDVEIVSQGGGTIPMGTPFKLTAAGTDDENHNLTYCWEQYDLGPTADLGTPILNGPSFRSYPPVSSPTRLFPKLSNVLSGTDSNVEVLPTYSRELTFRCTVRDDYTPAGGVMWEEISFAATEDAGPFTVAMPNGSSTWPVGSVQNISWNVNNTDQAPVNCQKVKIWLSTNNGNSFDVLLLDETDNDGSAEIIVPDEAGTNNRIMVESVGNVFFNINPGQFDITAASAPTVAIDFININDIACLPTTLSYDIDVTAIEGYNSPITYSIDGLPSGMTATFTPNPALPTDNLNLMIASDDNVASDAYNLTLLATGTDLSLSQEFTLKAVSQDFSSLSPGTPSNGTQGAAESTSLSWNSVVNANSYDVQISTNPAFAASNTEMGMALTATEFSTSQPLLKNTLYYWRVRGNNECGAGPWSEVYVFHTVNFSCNTLENSDLDFSIPKTEGTVSNTFNISQNGTIDDINVSNINLDFNPTLWIKVALESPSGTVETLYDADCPGQGLDIGFDNDATQAVQCPANDMGTYLPTGGDLNSFANESSQGNWKLLISTLQSAFDPGTLNSWALEICSNASPINPEIVNNKVLEVKTNDAQWIETSELLTTDADNTPQELQYTLVTVPTHGSLDINGTIISAGGTWTQSNIDLIKVKYIHTGSTATTDNFVFTVVDGTGGFIPAQTFEVNIDDNNPVLGIERLDVDQIGLFPNPASTEITVTGEQGEVRTLSLYTVSGKLLDTYNWGNSSNKTINVSQFAEGMYFLRIEEAGKVGTKKFSILRK